MNPKSGDARISAPAYALALDSRHQGHTFWHVAAPGSARRQQGQGHARHQHPRRRRARRGADGELGEAGRRVARLSQALTQTKPRGATPWGELFVSRGDSAVDLQVRDHALDAVALVDGRQFTLLALECSALPEAASLLCGRTVNHPRWAGVGYALCHRLTYNLFRKATRAIFLP